MDRWMDEWMGGWMPVRRSLVCMYVYVGTYICLHRQSDVHMHVVMFLHVQTDLLYRSEKTICLSHSQFP